MLCFARKGCNTDFFDAHEHIDNGTFTDVGVTNCANDHSFVCVFFVLHRSCFPLDPCKKLCTRENLRCACLKVFIDCLVELFLTFLLVFLFTLLSLEFVLEATMRLLDLFELFKVNFGCCILFIIICTLLCLLIRAFRHDIQLTIVNLGLLLQRREENVIDILLLEVLVPVGNQLLAQVVSLVDKEHEFFVFFTHFSDVFLEVCTVEEVWVPGVHDLKDKILR